MAIQGQVIYNWAVSMCNVVYVCVCVCTLIVLVCIYVIDDCVFVCMLCVCVCVCALVKRRERESGNKVQPRTVSLGRRRVMCIAHAERTIGLFPVGMHQWGGGGERKV